MELNNHLLHQEDRKQDDFNLDFMYQQIKELGDKLDKYNRKTGNPQESNSLLRGFIIERKNKDGFPLFKNDKFFISIIDYDSSSDEPLKLNIQIISPTLIEKTGDKSKRKSFKLNSSDIKKMIDELSINIGYLELAIKHDYVIGEEKDTISKEVYFGGGKEGIALLRSEILKLSSEPNISNVKQVDLDSYIISGKNFLFSIIISSKKLIIEGDIKNIEGIEEIFPAIENIIKKNKKLFVTKDTQEIENQSTGGLKKLFSFSNKKVNKNITEISDDKLDILLQNIMTSRAYLTNFLTNLENGFLDDISEFDDEIIEEIKNISIILIQDIILSSKGLLENSNPKKILYISYLIDIFNNGIKTPNLMFIYKYIANDENLEKKYGEKIKMKLLENKNYKGELFSQLFTCGDTDYYSEDKERYHDFIFSEDNMKIITTTSDNKGLLSYNIISQEEEKAWKGKKGEYKKISLDGKYILVDKKVMFDLYTQTIVSLSDNTKIQINKTSIQSHYKKSYFYKNYLITIYKNRSKFFSVYNRDTNTSIDIDIQIDMNKNHVSGDCIYYFETNRNNGFLNFSSYNLSSGDIHSLDCTLEKDEYPLDFTVSDNKLILVVANKNKQLIAKTFDIKNNTIDTDSIEEIDIVGFKDIFQTNHMHISNDGYILLQNKNDIYIIDTNNNLVYKHTPSKKINHLFKVQFVNSPEYGHFVIARDGNQIYKIDIGLIEKLVEPENLDDINGKIRREQQKAKEIEEKQIKEGKIVKVQKGSKESKKGLKNLGQAELQREIVAELRDSRAINAKMAIELAKSNKLNAKLIEDNDKLQKRTIEELEKSNQTNAAMLEAIIQLKDILSEKK